MSHHDGTTPRPWLAALVLTTTLFALHTLAADDGKTVAELTKLEHRFAEAVLRGEHSVIRDLLAPDFVGVDPRGQELSRDDVLANLRSPERQIESLRHEQIRVRVFDDCAVVFAVTVMAGRHGNRTVGGEFPYLRVWVKRQGRWLAVAAQSSAAPS